MPSTLPPWGRAYLDSGSTAIAIAMRVTRMDGQVFGWTNIRRPATLPLWSGPYNVVAQRYDSKYRLQVSNLERSARPDTTDNMEASVIAPDVAFLQDAGHGLFFNAAFTLLFFDWRTDRPLMLAMRGTLGERKIEGQKISFKMRSLSQALQNDVLDVTSPYSRAVWGDEELANFDLGGNTADGYAARLNGTITVDSSFPRRRFTLISSIGYPVGRFVGGTVEFLTGSNAGLVAPILDHKPSAGLFTLDSETRYPLGTGIAVNCQIRPPLTLDEWKLYFGTGFGFPGEPGIPNNTSASEITTGSNR